MSLDGRVRRLERGQRAAQPVDLAWREAAFDYDGFVSAFEELWATLTEEQRQGLEESWNQCLPPVGGPGHVA